MPAYAELHCRSNFSFLQGASHPEELVQRAHTLGYRALALTDECSLAGVVKAHVEARRCGLSLIIGSELCFEDGMRIVLLATDREGYGNLSQLITRGRCRTGKGQYRLLRRDLEAGLAGCLALWLPGEEEADPATARWLVERFPGCSWVGVALHRAGGDRARLAALRRVARDSGAPLVAVGGVRMHESGRRPLLDALTAIRLRRPLQEAGFDLQSNGERHLRTRQALARFYPPELLRETLAVAERCHFSLDQLRYEYPDELVPDGATPATHLRSLTAQGMARRWPQGTPSKVRQLLQHELALITELGYEAYFLTVHDIVRFARSRGILCQGRGSAANSAVCFCLGITEVDPARMAMLFERFISRERDEPPDIDVDFEHQRREEVIQYIYRKYGRDRAALAATVISYRPRSAIRDAGRALGLEQGQLDRLSGSLAWWDGRQLLPERLREAGFDPDNPRIRWLARLVRELQHFPRHLSQHVGGFVISRGPLSRLVPVENAAMAGRSVIQWDKNDLQALGLLKIDCLALGMLSAIRRAFALINSWHGVTSAAGCGGGATPASLSSCAVGTPSPARQQEPDTAGPVAGLPEPLGLHNIPPEDPAVYAMIQRAETTGVFQIESRAQMSMLPRLRPACFYDLVIEVAIVRPGPIQGDMVHPYLRRRQGLEAVSYPSAAVEQVLGRTLGIPIFQEQVIKVATVAAGFSPGEADRLRRSIAAWRRRGTLEQFESRLLEGMQARGYQKAFARQIYHQILGFGEYGFPESHAASFALLVYVSAWLKWHHPAAFFAALLNSRPMGFYAPAQLLAEARRQGVRVQPVDVCHSEWDCTLERQGGKADPALRLGLGMLKGLSRKAAGRLLAARARQPIKGVEDLIQRAGLQRRDSQALVVGGALAGLAGDRHQAGWQVLGSAPLSCLPGDAVEEALPALRAPTEGEDIVADYASLGLTLGRHPLSLLRGHLLRRGMLPAARVSAQPDGHWVRAAGIVINRQRPASSSGVTFVTLEDESGQVNLVVWRSLAERQRATLLKARLLGVAGRVQREGSVVHLVARQLWDCTHLLGRVATRSRDFH